MDASAGKRDQGATPLKHRHRWNKEKVLKILLEREAAGLALSSKAVRDDDSRLHASVLRVFGSWDAALRAAGISPGRVRQHRRWSQSAVSKRIQQRASQGMPLSRNTVCTDEANLVSAAIRHFGSWDNALAAAGFDPAQCRQRRRPWTPARVIAAIHDLRDRHAKLNHGSVDDGSLSHAGIRLFGSWDAALRAAGLNPDQIRRWRKAWTRDTIVQELRRRHRAGESLRAVDASPGAILRAACRLFGSWDAALEAAGFDARRIRGQRPPWTRDAIIREIRRLHGAGDALNINRVATGMCQRARTMFGSWRAAIEAAGIDPDDAHIRPTPWTADSVVQELRRTSTRPPAGSGQTVTPRSFRRAACRLFGSWEAAAKAAGLVLESPRSGQTTSFG